jgi:predicted porin
LFVFTLNPYNVVQSSAPGVTALVSGGESMSRLGFKGNEDLGGGLKAFFTLEMALATNSGEIANNGMTTIANNGLTNNTTNGASSVNGQLFSREATVGLSDKTLGSVKLGRNTAFSLDATAKFDPLMASGLYSPLGFSGALGGGLGITENARLDNSLKYENKFGPVSLGVQYKMGSQSANDADDVGTVTEAMMGYDEGPLSVALVGSTTKDSVGLGNSSYNTSMSLKEENSKGYELLAKYTVNSQLTVQGGVERTTLSAPSNNNTAQITSYYGMSLNQSGHAITPAAYSSTYNGVVTTYFLGGSYKITPQFNLMAGYYNINNAATTANTQYTVRAFSLLGSYAFSKMTDVYGGLMDLNYSGQGMVSGLTPTAKYATGATNNAIYGAGLRVKF